MNIQAFHDTFDAVSKAMLEPAREALLESIDNPAVTQEQIIAQVLMEFLNNPLSVRGPDAVFEGKFTVEDKERLVRVAAHMGPDWAQALYHAAVFITKVA